MSEKKRLRFRQYGAEGPVVFLLHGGPGAPGVIAPVARGLSDRFRAIEPWQRGGGDVPLTVAQHVADLDALIRYLAPSENPIIVGESWGAMLALAYAAEHPDTPLALALIGCGTFTEASRAVFQEWVQNRMTEAVREKIDRLEADVPDPGERMAAYARLLDPVYGCDAVPCEPDPEAPAFDMRAHTETWDDMLRLQREGIYPAAFSRIKVPVCMFHGDRDPHPGPMIRDDLIGLIPQLAYVEIPQCGHSPWRERRASEVFFARLRQWLAEHASP